MSIPVPMFSLGQLVATPGAIDAMSESKTQVIDLLSRYLSCDWGELDSHDKAMNDEAVITGEDRIFAEYQLANGQHVYVITEADRSVTTILLPEEY